MEQINKDRLPIFYKNAEEMDKPVSQLIDELRTEIARTRGKLYDIERSYGWKEWIDSYTGGLTCMISAMSSFQDELKKFEDKQIKPIKPMISIDDLDISVRCYQVLKRMVSGNLHHITKYTKEDFIRNSTVSSKTIQEIEEQMLKHNLTWLT